MFTKILPFPYDIKGVELGHYKYYTSAQKSLSLLFGNIDKLKDKAKGYSKQYNISKFQDELDYIHLNSVLNCACYIEATLNFLLTYKLGEKLFNETIERNSPEQKLLLAHVLYKNEIPVEKGNEYRLFKKVFQMRNEIAHAKSRKLMMKIVELILLNWLTL